MHPSLFSFFNRGVASIFALSFGIAAAPNGFCSDVFRGNETFQSFNKAKKILGKLCKMLDSSQWPLET